MGTALTKEKFDCFPQITHAAIGDKACRGGQIVPQIRGSYVALRCSECREVLGAIDEQMLRALLAEKQAKPAA